MVFSAVQKKLRTIEQGGDWNNFDFNLFFDGTVGNKIYNYPRYRLESGNFNGNYSTTLANSWRPDNQNTDMPRFSVTDGADNKWAYTDRWLEDGSYITQTVAKKDQA